MSKEWFETPIEHLPSEALESVPVFWYDDAGNIIQWGKAQRIEVERAKGRNDKIKEGVANGYEHRYNPETGRVNKIVPGPPPLPDPAAQRAAAYPPLTEFADALVHERSGNPEPMKKYVKKCLAVKKRFSKK